MKYDTAGKYKSTYKFEKKSSTFHLYFVNCLEMYTIVEKNVCHQANSWQVMHEAKRYRDNCER